MDDYTLTGDFTTAKHVPTRATWQLIIEIPEEVYPICCAQLGFPISGESIPVELKKL